ncbi:MAG: sulfotransferase domain-containing protein [Rhodanobacteraceae bacterium]
MDEPLFHAFPDRPGFPRYTIDLVSPEAPCGAGWLANCLIELGVPAWKQWNTDDRAHWIDLGDSRFRYGLAGSPWSRVLPSLVDGREFAFRAGEAVRVHHVWPDAYPRADRTILFVREPIDALYSAWHRQRRLATIAPDLDFPAFCASRFHHYPVSWADYLLLFLRVWRRALREFGGTVIRFEDYRRDAAGTLASALRALDNVVSPAEATRAIEASSLERVRAADQRLVAERVVEVPLVRGEASGAYLLECDAAAIAPLAYRFEDISDWLGYAPTQNEPRVERAAAFGGWSGEAILRAIRKTGVRVADDGWLAQAVRSVCNPGSGVGRRVASFASAK